MADKSYERATALGTSLKGYMFEARIFDVPAVENLNDIPLVCGAMSTPEREFTEIQRDFGQFSIINPGRASQDGEIDLTFKVQKDLYILDLIEEWQEAIISKTSGQGESLSNVLGVGKLYLLDDRTTGNNELARYNLKRFFPRVKQSLDFEDGSEDPQDLTVTFRYSNYSYDKLV